MDAHCASDLKLDYHDPTSRTVGSELVCSFITTGGGGAHSASGTHPWLRWNPHLRFQNNLRGYVNTTITRDSLEADFRCVGKVQSKNAEVFTRASFTIEDRKPGLNQTFGNPPAPALARSLSIGDDAGGVSLVGMADRCTKVRRDSAFVLRRRASRRWLGLEVQRARARRRRSA